MKFLILLNNNNINQNMEKSNNRYSSILKKQYNASGNKNNYMSYDNTLTNNLTNKNLDLLKDIQELMEHGDLNLYQILSDFKDKNNMNCVNINDIPQALKIASIDTNVDEVNNLLDVLGMQKNNLINIKDFLINVLLYKVD
jgi:predicted patatin/cPLA2 family phospholipase